jgi:hypothetical protein
MTLIDAGFDNDDGVHTSYNYKLTIVDSTVTGSGRFGVVSH